MFAICPEDGMNRIGLSVSEVTATSLKQLWVQTQALELKKILLKPKASDARPQDPGCSAQTSNSDFIHYSEVLPRSFQFVELLRMEHLTKTLIAAEIRIPMLPQIVLLENCKQSQEQPVGSSCGQQKLAG